MYFLNFIYILAFFSFVWTIIFWCAVNFFKRCDSLFLVFLVTKMWIAGGLVALAMSCAGVIYGLNRLYQSSCPY
jgi:hypothetical protein